MNSFIKEQLLKTKEIQISDKEGNKISLDDLDNYDELIIEEQKLDFSWIDYNKKYLFIFEGYFLKRDYANVFHKQYNKGNPVPLRIMYGKILKVQNNLLYIKVQGYSKGNSFICSRCLKAGNFNLLCNYCKNTLNLKDISELENIKWEGWITLKAVKELNELEE